MPKNRREPRAGSAAVLAAMAGLALYGCATPAPAPSVIVADPTPAPRVTADPPAAPTPAWAQGGPAVDMQRLLDRAGTDETPTDPVFGATPIANLAAAPPTSNSPNLFTLLTVGHKAGPFVEPEPAQGAPAPVAAAAVLPPATPVKSLTEQIDDTSIALGGLVSQQTTDPATAWKAYLTLAALDLIHPGSMPRVISPDARGAAVLSPEEMATADSVRQLLTDLASIPGDATASTRSARIAELADRVSTAAPMRISIATLAARVTGFGQYIPLGMDKMLQGRPQRAIVYVEVANFAHKPVADSAAPTDAKWLVNLTQTLQLFHDADGTLAWSRPEEEVIDESRNKRRDFYLVHEITLPPTLTVGAYRLKIIMRDKTSGQVDEAVIPFEVVADPALALQGGQQYP